MSDRQPSVGALEAIEQRRAVRAYRPEQPSDHQLRRLLEAAVRAPTALHREPWVFAIVQDRALLRRLSDRVKSSWRGLASTVEPHVVAAVPEARGFLEALARPDFNVFYDAGTLVLIGARPVSRFVEADCWLAAENLMIAASALGLGTCVIGAAMDVVDQVEVKQELGIPADVRVIAPIVVGIPASGSPPTSRRPAEVVAWRR